MFRLTSRSVSRFVFQFALAFALFLCLAGSSSAAEAVPTNYASYLDAIKVPDAWNLGFTGAGVTVGIIDDSFQSSHPYVSARVNEELNYNFGYRTTGAETDPSPYWDNYTLLLTKDSKTGTYSVDGDQHGVSTSGCVGAYSTADNVYGPAYGSTLAGLRIDFKNQSYQDDSTEKNCFFDALAYRNTDIRIKNNSYGISLGYANQSNNTTEIDRQITVLTDAEKAGTILVFSAGNERISTESTNSHDSNKKMMQAHPSTIVVAATGNGADYNSYAYFSDYGANVFVTAPGVQVPASDRTDASLGTNYYKKDATIAYFESAGYSVETSIPTYAGYASGNRFNFNGTSASAPVVSGVLALVVDAVQQNNTLNGGSITPDTRLMKHLIVQTAQKIDPGATDDAAKWTANAAGNSFSASYGFGQIDASAMVEMASDPTLLGVTSQTVASANWYAYSTDPTVPSNVVIESTSSEPILEYVTFDRGTFDTTGVANASSVNLDLLSVCETGDVGLLPPTTIIAENLSTQSVPITPGSSTNLTATFGADAFGTTQIQPLEEVALTIAISGTNLGSLRLGLESPSGTESVLAFEDADGGTREGDLLWTFTSNAFWGENPVGDWVVTVMNALGNGDFTLYEIDSTFFMGALNYATLPEPAAWILFAFGSCLLWAIRRRRP